MSRNIVFRIIAALVLLAAVAGIAGFAFNAGMVRGSALSVQAPATGAQPVPGFVYPAPYPYYWHPFFGFGFLGFLIPLFLFFLVFGAIRRLLWGPRWGMHHMGHHMHRGDWGENTPGGSDFVPPMFNEWHKRAHGETPAEDKKPQE